MFRLLRDKIATAQLKARYQRLVQERVLTLVEEGPSLPAAEESGQWTLLGGSKQTLSDPDREELRSKARSLVSTNPHAKNILRLLEIYVVGPGLKLSHSPRKEQGNPKDVAKTADRLWKEFLDDNHRHFSYREFARRTWRDGECFLRKFPQEQWPPAVRFIDPELIAPTTDHPDSQGIVSHSQDVETPLEYLKIDSATGELQENILADEIHHAKIGVDSNQKRGVTLFSSVIDSLSCFNKWLDIEILARKLQASIVLWRKVQGSPSRAASMVDDAKVSSFQDPTGEIRKERFLPGSIVTTSQGTDMQFLQPNTNFGDAAPLGRMLLLSIASGAGIPEFMLTSDASNGNFSSTMVAEGPAVKLFQSEQQFFSLEFTSIWRWVMSEAIRFGLLPDDFLDSMEPKWTYPQVVNRDRPRERMADVRLVDSKVISRSEVARRDGVDPELMQQELTEETKAAQIDSSQEQELNG